MPSESQTGPGARSKYALLPSRLEGDLLAATGNGLRVFVMKQAEKEAKDRSEDYERAGRILSEGRFPAAPAQLVAALVANPPERVVVRCPICKSWVEVERGKKPICGICLNQPTEGTKSERTTTT